MSTPEQTQQQVPGYAAPVGAPVANPGKGVGIAGFVLAFLGPLSIVGIILSIVGLVKSRGAGQKNGLALAGIIVGILVLLGTAAVAWLVISLLQQCADLGPGTHYVDGVTYTCG